MKRQAGFTLIELVMVIVILGILSAFALPRFADLGTDARKAALNGTYGAIKSASSIAHADALVKNLTASVTLEGSVINLVNLYPSVDDTVATLGTNDIVLAAQLTITDYTVAAATTASSLVLQAKGAATPASCQITYTEAAANSSPTISIVDTGC